MDYFLECMLFGVMEIENYPEVPGFPISGLLFFSFLFVCFFLGGRGGGVLGGVGGGGGVPINTIIGFWCLYWSSPYLGNTI